MSQEQTKENETTKEEWKSTKIENVDREDDREENQGSPSADSEYLRLVHHVLVEGDYRMDRTGTGTIALFGTQMRFDLKHGFPLLTTKRMFWKGVVEELLWIISGCTDSNVLSKKGIGIWDKNGTRDFLDKRGLTKNEVGDLGPIYGFQWRHWGAEYKGSKWDYNGQGFDQLADCIRKLNDPELRHDRRMIVSAWNPSDLGKMALPPCHMMLQFFVRGKNKLSCQMTQRSGDLGLGIPFNIASYSLLTLMIAHVCGLEPDEFIHSIGDYHIYVDHIEGLKQQLTREPKRPPRVVFTREVTDIDSFRYEDIKLVDYESHPAIHFEMSA